MSTFLYFLPGHNCKRPDGTTFPLPPELSHIDCDVTNSMDPVKGPGDVLGALISVHASKDGRQSECVYEPSTQTWKAVESEPGKVTHWIGWETANPPGPEDLERKETIEGHPVKLADGREWVIPAVHFAFSKVPHTFRMGPGQSTYLEPVEKYRAIMNEAKTWYESVQSGGEYNVLEWFAYFVNLLGVNYRIGGEEIGALGLAVKDGVMQKAVIDASLGVPDFLAFQDAKKKATEPNAG